MSPKARTTAPDQGRCPEGHTMTGPRIKPEHAPYRISGGRIRIGGVSFGIAAEVQDPVGSVWTLLSSMDGTRSVDEIVLRVLAEHPQEAAADVREAIDSFVGAGYVEDAGVAVPQGLSERDRIRYSRSLRYFRWTDLTPRVSPWSPQMALKQSKVTVVGLGGTGGNAALALAATGVGEIHCVDRDIVELSNLNRQVLYTEADLGLPKTEAAVRRLSALNSDIRVTGSIQEITGEEDLRALADDCDVLLLSADRPMKIRDWANRACFATGTPWVDAGYHGPLISVGVYRPGSSSCRECVQLEEAERAKAVGAHLEDAMTRSAPVANAVSAASAGISGHLAAHAAVALLTGAPPAPTGRVSAVNLVALDEPFFSASPPRDDCPVCGTS